MIRINIKGVNQLGKANIRAEALILVDSREHGSQRMPQIPPMTPHRSWGGPIRVPPCGGRGGHRRSAWLSPTLASVRGGRRRLRPPSI